VVSTGNQDLQMQIDANEVYIRNYDEDQVLKFQDYDVSATKLKINERPALRRLLKSIEEGKISKLIVYDRDRLARDVYEYVYIVKLCYKHAVQIIYTAAGAAPFSTDIIQETWYGLFAQMEGKKIQTRLYDVRNRYPQQLLGYNKVDKEKGRFYKKDKEVEKIIYQLFQDVSRATSLESLIDIVIRYCKSLKRDANRIIGILNTAFYSAHGRTVDGNYFKLDHVEPIIPLSIFTNVQDVLRKYGKSYEDVVKNTMKESILIPTCGHCGKQMVFRKGKIGTYGTYTCGQHRKNRISSEQVDLTLKQTVGKVINKIDIDKIKGVCRRGIRNYSNTHKQEQKILAEKIEELCVDFCANFTPFSDITLIHKPMKEIKSKKEKLFGLEEKIDQFNILTREISQVAEYVKYHLENELAMEEFLELVDLIVASVEIYSDYIKVNIYFDEFIIESGE
jgi:site-specific DNA recombinase